MTARVDGVLRVTTIIVVIGLGLLGFAAPESVLRGGLAWLAFLFFVCSGWGYLVVRALRVSDPDVGLRAVWGAAGYLAIVGVLVALGVSTRPVLLALIGCGVTGFAWRELVTPTPGWQELRTAARYVRSQPALGLLVGAIVALAIVHLLGAVAKLDRNPWDDDLAYTPLVRRVLDVGDLVEPFSFRRLSSYGGQTLLQALAGARGTLANVHLIDQGLCFGLALLLVVGHARERGTHVLWLALLLIVVCLLPDTSINTASYWSGVALFLALYRTVTREAWILVGLVAAATCTLRQSYLAHVVLFVGLVVVVRLVARAREQRWAAAWRGERASLARIALAGLVAILGWWIASYVSSRTFLFPMFDGTWNHALSLKPANLTWIEELQFLLWCCIEATPLVVVPPLVAVLSVVKDARLGKPLMCLFASTVLGFLLLVHSFTGSEPPHLWRYAFGPGIALLAVLVIETGAADDGTSVHVPPLGRWLVLVSLVLQLVVTRGGLPKHYAELFANVREARAIDRKGDPTALVEQRRHAALQGVIPPGARVAVMLDDPAFLDFDRNVIFNLDTPGYASPGTQLPSFEGPEALRAYLLSESIAYVAFVRPTASRYFFRREFWRWRIFNDSELFQTMSAYTIDTIDTLMELATRVEVLHDVEGLVVLSLGEPPARAPLRTTMPEVERRGAFVRALATREGMAAEWSLNSRENVRFEDGFSSLAMIDDAAIDDPTWFEITHKPTLEPQRATPARWLFRRAHVGLRGTRDMRLVLRGKVNLAAIYTRPRLDISLEGQLLASVVPDAQGAFTVDVVVPRATLGEGWRDLYLVFTSVVEPVNDMRDLRVARLLELAWEPASGTPP